MFPPNNAPARRSRSPGEDASLANWLSYLESIHPTEIDLGLDRVLVVFRRLFRSNPGARILTVGGTNGKGSTVVALEHLLASAGKTTGAYTSPHLQNYNERVRINGVDVGDADMVRAFARVETARQDVSLTYFEFGTLAAFVVFDEAGLDDWVLEVGLGGRLDAVNILDADLAIITSVDLDHMAYLGNDTESIGFEKAGILRPNRSAIFADLNPPRSVLQQARAQNVRLLRPGAGYELVPERPAERGSLAGIRVQLDEDATGVIVPDEGLPVNSLAAAVVAIRLLEPQLPGERIEQALGKLSLPGRFERLRESPLVIADVGHNPHAARWLCARVSAMRQPGQRVLAVYGALADKDVESVTAAMAAQVDQWFPAALNVPRGLGCDDLAARMNLPAGAAVPICADSVESALGNALRAAKATDIVLIFGSFFTVATARAELL